MQSTLPSLSTDEYRWGKASQECAREMFAARDRYRSQVKGSDIYARWVRAFRCYHAFADGASGDGSFLGRRGSKGQRAVTRNSRTATDARHAIGLISQAVPSLEGLPADNSPETLAQVRLVKRVFDYFMERRQLGRTYYQAAVGSFPFGKMWVIFDWDPFAGEALETPQAATLMQDEPLQDPAEAGPVRTTTGDITYRTRSPLDVVIDLQQTEEHDWMMVADPINRWELAARYPSQAEEIKQLPSLGVNSNMEWSADFRLNNNGDRTDNSDLVRVWTLYHRKCRAMPQGRMLCAASDDCWLFDGPLPYDAVPSVEIVAGDKIEGTPWNDSPMFHATGTQSALDRAYSAWITNVLATAHQFVSVPDPNFTISELSDGVSAIVAKSGVEGAEPRGISMTAPQGEIAKLIEVLKEDQDGTFATNSVIRGQPDANIRSGSYAGLLVQQAIQFQNPAQYSFQRGIEMGGNHLLAILKRFADKPLLIELAGPGGEWRQQAFSQKDISGIHRIYAKPGNPAERTSAYRRSQADFMLEHNLIKTRAEYLAACSTNQPELLDEDDETQVIGVMQQREMLLNGEVPPALETDDHPFFIQKFAALLSSPDARKDPALIQRVADAIGQHMQMEGMRTPELAAMLGQAPPAALGVPPPGAPEPTQPTGTTPPAPHPAAGRRPPAAKLAAPENTPEPAPAGP